MTTASTVQRTILIKQKSTGLLSYFPSSSARWACFTPRSPVVIMFLISIPIVLFTGGLGLLLTIPLGMV
ncbi:MAG: hypothetical protein IPI91_16660 [Flavobacteriales bacterium]|nr:hypothetical protein [Flavobacteriales bacterium]